VDTSLIEEELDWKPAHTLEKGLKDTVSWYLSNADWLRGVHDESYKTYYDQMYADRLKNASS
jgi:dTDP-glucose 4,6-dehydratase